MGLHWLSAAAGNLRFTRPQIETRAPNPSWSHLHTSGKIWLIFSLIFCHGRRGGNSKRSSLGLGGGCFHSDFAYVPVLRWLSGKYIIILSFTWCRSSGMCCRHMSTTFQICYACTRISSDNLVRLLTHMLECICIHGQRLILIPVCFWWGLTLFNKQWGKRLFGTWMRWQTHFTRGHPSSEDRWRDYNMSCLRVIHLQ